jgi:hypothetical protein
MVRGYNGSTKSVQVGAVGGNFQYMEFSHD